MKLAILIVACLGAAVALPLTEQDRLWEKSGYYQGDIKLTEDQKNGITNSNQYWPNRVVPYAITGSFSAGDRATIDNAIAWYNANTCMNLVQRTNEANYVNIINSNSGCYSYVGRIGGAQELNLQTPGCVYHSTIVHELLHALGFYHMQSATERDDWVTIMWQNIQAGMEHNFDKYDASFITSFGVPYDYGSVMHYGPNAFSSNGQPTIVPNDPNANIGSAQQLSSRDIQKLHAMYGC